MVITTEQIKGLAGMADVSEETLNAIVELTTNTIDSEVQKGVAKQTGEIYSRLDQDIAEATGIEKKGTEEKTLGRQSRNCIC